MRRLLIATLIAGFLAAGAWWYFRLKGDSSKTEITYDLAPITRGDVRELVSATGSLSARNEVLVGTQVSGNILKVLADFNDTVEAGQLIALLDTRALDTQVATARADLARSEAQLDQANQDVARKRQIFEKRYLSQGEFLPYLTAQKTAEAAVKSAQAALERAITNRNFGEIYSPIKGIVVNRQVEPGQTVIASLNSPTLFTIAESLETMQILANVDESDIGRIRAGQPVTFTVAAYPDETFQGSVEEIRLMPQVISNVVNYTVVVLTENPRKILLPGMTATLSFVVDESSNVLTVPAAAVNLRLTDEMRAILEKMGTGLKGAGAAPEGSGRKSGGKGGAKASSGSRKSIAHVWRLNAERRPVPVRVKSGVTDGITTEITPVTEGELKEGQEIISRVNLPTPPAESRASQGGSPPRGFTGRPF